MQIVVNRQDLLTVLKRAGSAVNSSDMLSVRRSVLIVASEDGGPITFGATDGMLGIVCQAAGETKAPGQALLNHRELVSRIDRLPEGHVQISVDAKFHVLIRSSSSKMKFTMTGLAPEDFPALLNEQPGEPMYSLEAKILQQAASEVAFGIAKDRIDGALLAPGDDMKFHLVTLSGHAMVVATGWFTERHQGGDLLLPRTLLEAIGSIDPKAILTLSTDTSSIYAQVPGMLVRASQLQAKLPADFQRVLASAPQHKRFTVSSEAFLTSVKAVSVAADYVEGAERFIQIDVTCDEGVVTVRTRQSERSQGEDELSVTHAAPGGFAFHADAAVLSQALRSFAPADLDLYYDFVMGYETLFLKNETLAVMMTLISDIKAKPHAAAKDKK
jgi:DNA polymerase III sliding clamp (beta) subunit (PCNA family)